MLRWAKVACGVALVSLVDPSEAFHGLSAARLHTAHQTRLAIARNHGPAQVTAKRSARSALKLTMKDEQLPLLKRAGQTAASLAVLLSLAMPMYMVPSKAEAQPNKEPISPSQVAKDLGQSKKPVSDEALKKIQDKAELFGEILADLQDLYVEPVDLDKLSEVGFQAMLNSLDPYTEFENIEAAKVMRTQTIGNYGGVGLVIAKNKDKKGGDAPYITVANAFEGYAYDAGMRVGDTLISVDGKDVKDTKTDEVSVMLKGEPGSKVKITYKRPGLDGEQTCELTRKIVLLRDVPLGMTLGKESDGIGYVQLKGFSSTAPAELAYVIGQLQSQKPLKALVLDLRGNPGGLLSSAIKVSEIFIDEGDKIVTTRGRTITKGVDTAQVAASPDTSTAQKTSIGGTKTGSPSATFETIYKSDPIAMGVPDGKTQVVFHPPLLDKKTKVVVLVNKGTASAAEIVSGAIQDHDRGIIMGETTYGKGLVQQLQRLGQGGQQIKFTIGKYYTPSGRCIQNKAYTAKNGQLGTDEVKVKEEDRKVFYTDAGRVVRDSGGIEPDIVKKQDKMGELELELERKNLFFEYANAYEAKHLADGEEVAKQAALLASDDVYDDFKQFVLKQTDSAIESPFDKSLDIMKTALDETGYTAALSEVETLKKKLKTLTLDEFTKNEKQIRKRLDLTLRQRFVPESVVTSVALYGDKEVEDAFDLVRNDDKYESILKKSNKASTLVASETSKQELVEGDGAWAIFGGHP